MKAPKISRGGSIGLPGPPLGPPPPAKLLRVAVPEQDRTKWCWAAVGLGVRQAYGSSVNDEQCDIAYEVLTTIGVMLDKKCCVDSDPCNKGADIDLALGPDFVDQQTSKRHRTMRFVKDEISRGHPIAVQILRNSGGHHAVVISGYYEANGRPYLWICDPEYGDREPCPFDKFKGNYDDERSVWEISFRTNSESVPEQVEPVDAFIFN